MPFLKNEFSKFLRTLFYDDVIGIDFSELWDRDIFFKIVGLRFFCRLLAVKCFQETTQTERDSWVPTASWGVKSNFLPFLNKFTKYWYIILTDTMSKNNLLVIISRVKNVRFRIYRLFSSIFYYCLDKKKYRVIMA